MKRLIIIPQWLISQFESNNLPINDVVNEDVLISTLSNDDVGFYIFINNQDHLLESYLGKGTSNNFRTGFGALCNNPDRIGRFEEHYNVHVLEDRVNPYTLEDLLFGALSGIGPDSLNHVNFEIKEIDENTIGLVPYLQEEKVTSTKSLKKDLLKVLSKYTDFQDLVKTGLFKHYLVEA